MKLSSKFSSTLSSGRQFCWTGGLWISLTVHCTPHSQSLIQCNSWHLYTIPPWTPELFVRDNVWLILGQIVQVTTWPSLVLEHCLHLSPVDHFHLGWIEACLMYRTVQVKPSTLVDMNAKKKKKKKRKTKNGQCWGLAWCRVVQGATPPSLAEPLIGRLLPPSTTLHSALTNSTLLNWTHLTMVDCYTLWILVRFGLEGE